MAVSLLLGLFAGCGSTDDADSGEPTTAAPPILATPVATTVVSSITESTTTESSSTSMPPTTPAPTDPPVPETTAAITLTAPNFLEFVGADIFGDVVAGGGSVWIATRKGLIQVDPTTMEATWHADVAPGIVIAFAFDSLWVAFGPSVTRLDPTTLAVIATIPVHSPEGIAAGLDGVWVSQHRAGSVVRIDPVSNAIAETIPVVDDVGQPMDPTVAQGEVWLALGNARAVVRIDAARSVTTFPVPSEVLAAPVATPDAVWFAAGADITRVDRATGEVTLTSLPREIVGAFGGIGRGINLDGTLWFPASGDTMIGVDPKTAHAIGSVPLQGATPRNVIVFEDALWVMSEAGGSLERIPLGQLVAT